MKTADELNLEKALAECDRLRKERDAALASAKRWRGFARRLAKSFKGLAVEFEIKWLVEERGGE